MRRNDNKRSNAKKERVIMIASSVFVLAALTMTGIYMKSTSRKEQDDGYTIDFTALENNVDEKLKEIAQNAQGEDGTGIDITDGILPGQQTSGDDFGYEPVEAGSGQVEIPGLTGNGGGQGQELSEGEVILPKPTAAPVMPEPTPVPTPEPVQEPTPTKEPVREPERPTEEPDKPDKGAPDKNTPVVRTLHFAESGGLRKPLEGETLMPFSMDGSIYFSTLQDYRYNPALMIAAEVGTPVTACADGKVIAIFQNEEIGHAVTLDMGDGYQLTYGQLEGINVSLNSYVSEGDLLGVVAKPTKYFCVEGSNLYLMLTRGDKTAVDPELLFR